jgi:hypothetical protein
MHADVFGEQASSATPIFLQRAQAAYERHAEIKFRPARGRSHLALPRSGFGRQRRRESTASDSDSSKVHRRGTCLATAQIKPVSLRKHAKALCLFYLSDDVASPSLPPHHAPGVRRCSAIALCLGGAFVLFGLPPSSFVARNETLQQATRPLMFFRVSSLPPPL